MNHDACLARPFRSHISIALAFLCAIWWIDHAGYRRAMEDRDRRDVRMLDQVRLDLRQSEVRLIESIASISGDYQRQHEALTAAGMRLQPIIIGETRNAPRLADPAAGLTPGLLDAINRARAAGACAATASGVTCQPVPASASGDRAEHR